MIDDPDKELPCNSSSSVFCFYRRNRKLTFFPVRNYMQFKGQSNHRTLLHWPPNIFYHKTLNPSDTFHPYSRHTHVVLNDSIRTEQGGSSTDYLRVVPLSSSQAPMRRRTAESICGTDGNSNTSITDKGWGIFLATLLFIFHKIYQPSTTVETTFWDVKSVGRASRNVHCNYDTGMTCPYVFVSRIKVNFALKQAPKSQRGSRGIALLNRDLGARRWWMVSTTLRPIYPWERPGTHCTGGWVGPRASLDMCEKSRPHRIFLFIFQKYLIETNK
jgi:hypothetical protein